MSAATTPDEFARQADEVQLVLIGLPLDYSLSVLAEVMARILAQSEAVPDRRFLDMLQRRTLAILTEEQGHELGR